MNAKQLRLIVALLALTLTAIACSAPPVAVRRTALAPLANGVIRTGRPMEAGELRVGGHVSHTLSGPEADVGTIGFFDEEFRLGVPNEEDPAVWIPRTVGGGFIYFAPIDELEFGLSATVGSMATAESNFPEHVLEFEADPMIEIATGVRGNIPIADTFTLSITGQVGVVNISQATWLCQNTSRINTIEFRDEEPLTGWCSTNEEFDLKEIDSHTTLRGSLMVEPVFLINDMFSALLHFGVSQSVRNIGFDPIRARAMEHTLEHYAVGVVGGGVEATFRYGFVGMNFDYLISSDEAIGDMASFTLNTGFRLPSRRERTVKLPAVEPVDYGPAPPSMQNNRTPQPAPDGYFEPRKP